MKGWIGAITLAFDIYLSPCEILPVADPRWREQMSFLGCVGRNQASPLFAWVCLLMCVHACVSDMCVGCM